MDIKVLIRTIVPFAFFSSLVFLLTFAFPGSALAQETINDFSVQILAHRDGSFDVTEKIIYDFGTSERHGIYRDIPLVSKVGDLYRIIEVNFKEISKDGLAENYSKTITGSTASVKIGNADTTISGLHTYIISYLVKNGMGSNFPDHDELYWNATGNSWKIPIKKASAAISTDFGAAPDRAACYTGASGSTSKDCDAGQTSFIEIANSLNPYEGLTVVWGFPKGTFPASVLQKQAPGETNPLVAKLVAFGIIVVPVLLNLVLAPMLLIWYFRNKRKERFGPPAVNFDLPKDRFGERITPAEAGSMDIHKVDQNDIIATIFDLAIRKYIKIKQVKTKKILGVFGGGDDYEFIKLKDFREGTASFEKVLLAGIFSGADSVKVSGLKTGFYKTFEKVEQEVFDSLIKRSFYIKNPKNQMALLLFLGIFSIFSGGILLGPVFIFLSRKLNGRTALGDEADWRSDGLKIFLKNMKRHYSFQVKNLYTVEKYIPYAIAFGFIKEFMEQIKVIYPNYHPSWYTGQHAFYLSSSNMFSSMNSSFTTSAPSSSSGFSGGGSSGGGGGGGGGGSW